VVETGQPSRRCVVVDDHHDVIHNRCELDWYLIEGIGNQRFELGDRHVDHKRMMRSPGERGFQVSGLVFFYARSPWTRRTLRLPLLR
jgi:hypothetical protein